MNDNHFERANKMPFLTLQLIYHNSDINYVFKLDKCICKFLT